MSVAVVGGAAIGVVGTMYAANKSSSAAKKAAKTAAKSDQAALDFDKQRYQEWQDTYGALEDNLANYYETLTPTMIATQGLEAFNKERDIQLTSLRENLAQRGIGTSGIAGQIETDVALMSAAERAKIRANAPMEAAKQKSSFLQIGLGQNPAASVSAELSNQANRANQRSDIAAANAGTASAAVGESVTQLAQAGLDWYLSKRQASANPGTGD